MDKKIFDKHNWKPKAFSTAKSINDFLKKNGITKKKIKRINTIGMAENMHDENYVQTMRGTLADVGVSYDDIDSGKYPYIDSTLIPCEVVLCEPVVVVFEDNSTLEIKPTNGRALLMSVNQIDCEIVDGTNKNNYNSDILFNGIIGSSIEDSYVYIHKESSVYGRTYREEHYTYKVFKFWLSDNEDNLGFFFKQSYNGWFQFGLFKQNWFMGLSNVTERIPYLTFKEAAYNNRQIEIVEGHDGGGYFWVMPVKRVEKSEDHPECIFEYRKEEISISEETVSSFLYYFLKKYFDHEFPYEGIRNDDDSTDFEWWLTYNIYTYESISAMMDEIEEKALLLETDYYNDSLTELKSGFHLFDFINYREIWDRDKEYINENKDKLIKDNISIATDFYKRFIKIMRDMMKYSPEYNLISFMGP